MENGQTASVTHRIEDALPLVKQVMYRVAVRFPRHVDREGLVRAGVLGLVQAAHRYDAGKGVAFPAFAAPRIRGAILDAVRTADWAPRSVRREGRRLEAASEQLANRLHRTPTSAELAAEVGLSPGELADLQHRLARTVVLSLDAVICAVDGDDDRDEVVLRDALADPAPGPEDQVVDRELQADLRAAVERLPDRHRLVIRGYFFAGRTSHQLARELGVTVSRISQLRSEAFEMMRESLGARSA